MTNTHKSKFSILAKDFWILYKFFSSIYFRSFISIIIMVGLPLAVLVLMGNQLGAVNTILIMIPMLSVSFISIPSMANSFKRTSLIKRIGVTRISKANFFMTLMTFSITITLGVSILSVLLSMSGGIIKIGGSGNTIPLDFKWGWIILNILMSSILFSTLGIAMGLMFRGGVVVGVAGIVMMLAIIATSPAIADIANSSGMTIGGYVDFLLGPGMYLTPMNISVAAVRNSIVGGVNNNLMIANVLSTIGISSLVNALLIKFMDFNKAR